MRTESSPRRAPTWSRLLAPLALAACATVEGATGGGGAEQELAMRSQAMQRTVVEATVSGAALGAVAGYLLGDGDFDERLRSAAVGGAIGGLAGAAAGSYVGSLQQRYASKEDQLERLRADVEATNAETAATIRSMRAVVAQQRRELADARRAGAPQAVAAEEQAARRNLQLMQGAIGGAENRLADFQSTRSLNLVRGQATGADAEIGELRQQIAEMRSVAGSLAEDL